MTRQDDGRAAPGSVAPGHDAPGGPIRVVIVEDDAATLDRLVDVVGGEADMHVAGRAETFADAQALIAHTPCDVLLTDLGLPDGSGLDLIRLAQRVQPEVDVMVITVFGDEAHVLAAIEAGATGYLLKDGTAAYVCDSIRQLLAGGSPISPAIARHLLRRFVQPPAAGAAARAPANAEPAPRSLLTPKEVEVLQQIAKGFSYAEIASALGVTVHTVTTHIKHLYRKLAVRSRGEAVFEAVQLGLIEVRRHDERA